MIGTLNKSKTALSINKQEFKAALSKIGDGIDKQIASLKKAKQSYDTEEMAREVISIIALLNALDMLWKFYHPKKLRVLILRVLLV